MSARNGSGRSRLKRSQYSATHASAAAQTSWTKARQRPPVEMVSASRVSGPSCANDNQSPRTAAHEPTHHAASAGAPQSRVRDTRRPPPFPRCPPSARHRRRASRHVLRPADAAAGSSASCAPSQKRSPRSARRASVTVASAMKGRNTSSGNHARPAPSTTPPMPNAAARNPSGTAPTSPTNIRAGGQIDDENRHRRRRERAAAASAANPLHSSTAP